MLKEQALASINSKSFHAYGGSIYALYPGISPHKAVKFIVALQTISDYLDNLCDRAGVYDEKAFRQLHLSMLDAVDPDRTPCDYYLYYPHKDDNGYLKLLVNECRSRINELPTYNFAIEPVRKYVSLYSDLQAYKHLNQSCREDLLSSWANIYLNEYHEISCWEFSAAAGSTLGMFMMYAAAHNKSLSHCDIAKIDAAYFPWICGLHILLDYFIDSQEDMETGDLNFTSYYRNMKYCEDRLSFFIKKALGCCLELQYPKFHTTVVKGLLAMYLSDKKASLPMNIPVSRSLIRKGSSGTPLYHTLCNVLRSYGVLR